jgi:hypothetical protein
MQKGGSRREQAAPRLRRVRLYWTAWVGAGAAALFVATSVAAGAAPLVDSCARESEPSVVAPAAAPRAAGVILEADDGAKLSLPFGDSRAPDNDQIFLKVFGGEASAMGLDVLFGSGYLESAEGNRIAITDNGVHGSISVVRSHLLAVCLAVDPSSITGFRPGRYTGSVVIAAGDMQKETVPVEVSFRSSHWNAVTFAFLGVFLGLAVKVLSEAAGISRQSNIGPGSALRGYVCQLTFPVTLILAAIAGWIGYVHLYGGDHDWGASGNDAVKLFASCFIVQMSGSEAMSLLSRVAGTGPAGAS